MPECELVYCLTNTPTHMIENMVQRETFSAMSLPHNFDKDMQEIEDEIYQKVTKQHQFDHIPKKNRVKRFIIKRDQEVIDKMIERIEICRNYYDQLLNLL
jgi:hypothetical protein